MATLLFKTGEIQGHLGGLHKSYNVSDWCEAYVFLPSFPLPVLFLMKSLFRSLFAATLIALVAVGLVGCDDKEKKQQLQIDELTTEIKQIEDAKTSVEGTLDSLTRDREAMVTELTASKTSAADLTTPPTQPTPQPRLRT
jgi:hypothetical protein